MQVFAIIRAADIHPPTRHRIGLPVELSRSGIGPIAMPWPRIAIIAERPDGVFLDRVTIDGSSAGDTWHESVDDAKEQALAEYDGMLGEWHQFPAGLLEGAVVEYALSRAVEHGEGD